MSANVVKFPKAKRSLPPLAIDASRIKEAMPKASSVKGVLQWVWLILRIPIFLVMYWLRLPIVFLCNIISFPALLLWLFSLYAFPDKTAMVWGFGIMSFAAFLVGWCYDFVLMAIAPQDLVKSL